MKKRKFDEDSLEALILQYLTSHEYNRSADAFSKESGFSHPSSSSFKIEDLFTGANSKPSTEDERPVESLNERRRSKSSSPFKRVDADVWLKEVKVGLHDNSCKLFDYHKFLPMILRHSQMRKLLASMDMAPRLIKFFQGNGQW